MDELLWDEELTHLAHKNQKHQPWQVINPHDMLNAIRIIDENPTGYPIAKTDNLKEGIGTKSLDFLTMLKNFGFTVESHTPQGEPVYIITKKSGNQNKKQYVTGENLVRLVLADGLSSIDALQAIGHNFILKAREALELCSNLIPPGLSAEALKSHFQDHLVFNNKLNEFKFQNLLKMLESLKIITRDDYGYKISFSPAPLTFYCMVERYLPEADYRIGEKVHAGDLKEYLDTVLPYDRDRSEVFDSLGLTKFPFEGWGKHSCWLTGKSFRELLQVGLVNPRSVVKVLRRLCQSSDSQQADIARSTLSDLKKGLIEECKSFKGEVIGLNTILREYNYK